MNRKLFKIIVLTFATLFCFFITSKDTFAIDCSDNDATQWACKMNAVYNCTSDTRCGALWLNGSSSFSSGSTAKIAADGISLGDIGGTITVYLHGAVYNYGSPGAYTSQTAYHIKILTGLPGEGPSGAGTAEPENVSNLVSFMTTEGDSLDRGGSDGTQGTWSSGSSTPLTVKVDVVGLIDGADSVTTNDDGSKTFSKAVYIYRCFRQDKNDAGSRGCGANPSTISITFDPECEEYTYTADYKGKTSFDVGQYSSSGSSGDSSNIYSNGSLLTKAGDDGILQNTNWEPDGGNEPNVISGTYYTKMEQGQKFAFKYKMKLDEISPSTPALTTQKPGGSDSNWRNWLKSSWKLEKQELFSDKTRWQEKTGTASFKTSLNKIIKDYSDRYITTSSGFIPYGTSKTISERFSFNNNGDKYAERKICKVFKGLKHKKNGKIVEKVEVTIDKLTAKDRPDSGNTRKKSTEIGSDITLKNPYNFGTSVSTTIGGAGGATVIGGGQVSISFSAKIFARVNTTVDNDNGGAYYTKLPAGTQVKTAVFLLDDSMTFGTAQSLPALFKGGERSPQSSLCAYIQNSVGVSNIYGSGSVPDWCSESIPITDANNNIGTTPGTGTKQLLTSTSQYVVPDVDQGNKFCAVMAITRTDSHGQNGTANISGDGKDGVLGRTNDNWNISNVSCRTIARVPSFQVWGGAYTNGAIQSVIIKKIPGATFNTPATDPGYLFGSWVESFAVANGNIKGFSSGAAIAYNGTDQKGGLLSNSSPNFGEVSKFSISNLNAGATKFAGQAGNVIVSNSDLIAKIKERYSVGSSRVQKITDSIYAYAAPAGDFNKSVTIAPDGSITAGNGSSSNKFILNDKSLVYFSDGDVTISNDICTGVYPEANCGKGTGYTLSSSNLPYTAGVSTLPQVIIIANGNVNIQNNVKQIDAWIITDKEVNTCSNGNIVDGSCETPLIINGPVLAKNIVLKRTHGGNGIRNWTAMNIDTQIFNKGSTASATPAEIFNLRPDTYQWIYQQTTTEDKAAIVRYIRELAPRY